jgi:hypothetical protein
MWTISCLTEERRPAGPQSTHIWSRSSRWYTSAMNHRVCLRLLMHFSINHSVLYNMTRARYTVEQRVCFVQICFKHESARKYRRKFQHKFPGEPVPSRQNIHYLVRKVEITGSLLDKPGRKRTVLTEETLDGIDARLETSPGTTSVGNRCFEDICTKGHKIVKTATILDNGSSCFEETWFSCEKKFL